MLLLQNSNTSLLFWNLLTGLKLLNDISLTYKILSTTMQPSIYSLVSIQPPHGHNTLRHSDQTIFITHSHSSLLPTCFAAYLWNQLPTSPSIPHPNHSSPSQRPSFEHAGLTCYTLLSLFIIFAVSFWDQNLLFQKILSSALVCFCLSNWSHGCRPFTGFICLSVLFYFYFFLFLVIPTCGGLCHAALWSTFRRTKN